MWWLIRDDFSSKYHMRQIIIIIIRVHSTLRRFKTGPKNTKLLIRAILNGYLYHCSH